MPSKCWKTRLKSSCTKRSRKIKFFHLLSAKPFCKIVAQASCLPGLTRGNEFTMLRVSADWKSALHMHRAENRSAGILPNVTNFSSLRVCCLRVHSRVEINFCTRGQIHTRGQKAILNFTGIFLLMEHEDQSCSDEVSL